MRPRQPSTSFAPDPAAVADLRSRLRGPLLLPTDPGYDEARSLWNGMIDRHPALVARCLGAADVIAVVDFAREQGLPLAVKGGGHGIAGLALCDGGLVADLSLMRGVWVDRRAATARAQGGCLLGDVDRETQIHGLAAPLGFVSATGIGGLTVGGGFGYLTRRFGWTCDSVLAMDVVTAEGRLVRASAEEHPDLFWALRGGGGNFGVVTSFAFQLEAVGPQVTGGLIAWEAEQAPAVLQMYGALFEKAPRELTCVAILRNAPPAPWLPAAAHGRPIVALAICHTGAAAEGERLVADLRRFGSPLGDVLGPRTYLSQQTILDATQPRGRRYYWKSEYLPRLSPELLAAAAEHARGLPSPHSAIVLFPLGGAVADLPGDHSPMGNRDAACVLNITGQWERAEDDEANVAWARTAWQDLRRFSTGGTYVNFLTQDEDEERVHAAYGPHYDRLAEIKARWDPANLFRMNKNIAPRGAPRP